MTSPVYRSIVTVTALAREDDRHDYADRGLPAWVSGLCDKPRIKCTNCPACDAKRRVRETGHHRGRRRDWNRGQSFWPKQTARPDAGRDDDPAPLAPPLLVVTYALREQADCPFIA
jgi:hypothetical protein